MTRPNAVVFQDAATDTTTTTTPPLDGVIVGPAYQIIDYPKHASQTEIAATYGDATQATLTPSVPTSGSLAIAVAAPPNILPGAELDADSLTIYLTNARVSMGTGTDGVTLLNDNVVTSAGADFVTLGIAAGDTLVIQDPGGGATPLVRTISSVESSTSLRVTSNFTTANTALSWRIERALSTAPVVDDSFVPSPTLGSNSFNIMGGITTPVGSLNAQVIFANIQVAYRALRTDLQTLGKIEDPDDILTAIGEIDARNPLAVAASVARANSGSAAIYFWGTDGTDIVAYEKARGLISNEPGGYAMAVLYDEDLSVLTAWRNDFVARANPNTALATGTPQRFRSVLGATQLPETAEISTLSSTATSEQTAGFVPAGNRMLDLTTLDALTNVLQPGHTLTITNSATSPSIDGTYTIAHVNSATEVELNESLAASVSVATGLNYVVTDPTTNNNLVTDTDNQMTASVDGVDYLPTVAGTTIPSLTITDVALATPQLVEVAGTSTTIQADITGGAVLASDIVTVLADSVNFTASTAAAATVQATAGAVVFAGGDDPLTSLGVADEVYSTLFDPNATFLSDGVVGGDVIEVPVDPNATVFGTTPQRFVVDAVLSEQRLTIVNASGGAAQNNTATTVNELPHTVKRSGGVVVTQGAVTYQIQRELTTTQQVTALVAQAQSVASSRALLMWSDSVTVTGLTDGSLPKNADGTDAAAGPQPGYYLAAAVAGQTAGNPSHQGFSRLSIAGISRIFNGKDRFSEAELTQLSDGGLYVFSQDDVTANPYCIHQLTTDPSSLLTGEYSVARNFDYVSEYFRRVGDPFLGVWNINDDTKGFIFEAYDSAKDRLASQRTARIGAPIKKNDTRVVKVTDFDGAADRLEAYINVGLPKPLNVIGLHVVSV